MRTTLVIDDDVLIAARERAAAWVGDGLGDGWASCAITENGFIRIPSRPRYPSPVSPSRAVAVLRDARGRTDHLFWPCDVSPVDPSIIAADRVHGSQQLTDAYLLALAMHHGGRLVTLDRRIALDAVPGAEDDRLVVL